MAEKKKPMDDLEDMVMPDYGLEPDPGHGPSSSHSRKDKRVIIEVVPGELHLLWRKVEEALIKANCPVFVRGGMLVWPKWRWEKENEFQKQDTREVLTLQIAVYSSSQLQDMVAHHAVSFIQYDGRTKRLKPIDPPAALIETLRGAGHWRFQTLRGVISAPTVRPDGTLLDQEGYDPATKLWFKADGGVTLPAMPEKPSRADAKKALRKLKDLLQEFSFADGQSLSVALAAILTVVLRGAFLAVPIFLITAPEPRSGKTYLIQVTGIIATGHRPVNTAGSINPEEMEKRIEAAGLAGRQILHFNNLPNGMALKSQALAQMSTEGQFVVRKLGGYEEGIIDCQATTAFVNGNNVTLSADLVERCAFCRINARMEDPGLRKFKYDPIEIVRKARGEYLAACFTIARAYLDAGAPKDNQTRYVAGFEGWARFVQGPLVWLGCEDPLKSQLAARAMDADREQLFQILGVLRTIYNDQETTFTTAELMKLAEEMRSNEFSKPVFKYPELRELMTFHGRINAKSFGRLLARHLDRTDAEGWGIMMAGKGGHVNNYLLFKVGGAGTGAKTREPGPGVDDEVF
jgi:putative DNA primase/helicase